MTIRFVRGDCRDVLAQLPADSVHCVVTSPPYWGLRDYGIPPTVWGGDAKCRHRWGDAVLCERSEAARERSGGAAGGHGAFNRERGCWCQRCGAWRGAHGLEPTIDLYVRNAVEVFREVRRVLRPDGTLWLNLGDSYATGTAINRRPSESTDKHGYWTSPDITCRIDGRSSGLKPKDLCGIPWRVAFALQADGWWLRQDIIWSKPNPMPESVTDRCTKAHEYLFLLSKSARYYFDAEAIKEGATAGRLDMAQNGLRTGTAYLNGNIDNSEKPGRASGNKRHKGVAAYEASETEEHRTKAGLLDISDKAYAVRNKRSVWTVATSPFPEAHFATFPPKLIEPCIKAGTSERGCCTKCGAPWKRKTGRPCKQCGKFIPTQGKSCEACGHVNDWKAERGVSDDLVAADWSKPGRSTPRKLGASGKQGAVPPQERIERGWRPTCKCAAAVVPATVLDCFGGAGTTGLVADRLQRNAILIEFGTKYVAMARRRIAADRNASTRAQQKAKARRTARRPAAAPQLRIAACRR